MKYTKIVICITVLAACLLTGIANGQDYLQGGYVRSHDRSMTDPGIAGMLQWLEYYATTGAPIEGGIISNPAKFDITQKTPSSVFYGAGVGLPFSQYDSVVPSKTNDLWIQGATNWTQYVITPVGTWLQLVAYAPVEGPAGFYETIQTDNTSPKYKTYQFNQGYNTMNFKADEIGRHMLYFVVNSQPSNVVIVDVLAQAQQGSTTQIEHTMS
jgi:hypothetical protein